MGLVYDAVYVLVDGNVLRLWAYGLGLLIGPILRWPGVLALMALPVMMYVTVVRLLSARVPPTMAWRVFVGLLLGGILSLAIVYGPFPATPTLGCNPPIV